MKGKVKLIKKENGFYYAFYRNNFWQRWKPLESYNEQIKFKTFKEFGEITAIECFDEIEMKYNKFSGLKG